MLPTPWEFSAQEEVRKALNICITFIISVIAGIIADYLYDRLTEKKNGNKED